MSSWDDILTEQLTHDISIDQQHRHPVGLTPAASEPTITRHEPPHGRSRRPEHRRRLALPPPAEGMAARAALGDPGLASGCPHQRRPAAEAERPGVRAEVLPDDVGPGGRAPAPPDGRGGHRRHGDARGRLRRGARRGRGVHRGAKQGVRRPRPEAPRPADRVRRRGPAAQERGEDPPALRRGVGHAGRQVPSRRRVGPRRPGIVPAARAHPGVGHSGRD